MQTETVAISRKRNNTRLTETLPPLDPTKKLSWLSTEMLGQFHTLVMEPPIHSVVIEIGPSVADELLKLSNVKNRPLNKPNKSAIQSWIDSGMFELTGDTVKFDREGRLIDGQHRLLACADGGLPITTHVVFGLDPAVFDILDQGRKRTAADVLATRGVADYSIVAAAVRWLIAYDSNGGQKITRAVSPREIRRALETDYQGVGRWVSGAVSASRSYKFPPSIICAVLYLIARHNPELAEKFVREWVYGNRIGANATFDVMLDRVNMINRQAGHVPNNVRFSFLVQTFNHWNAGIVAVPRVFVATKAKRPPMLEFDAERFKAHKDDRPVEVGGRHHKVLLAMVDRLGKDSLARISWAEIAEVAGVSLPMAGKIIRELETAELIEVISRGGGGITGEYRILPGTENGSAA